MGRERKVLLMTTFDINIKKLNENATIPSYGSEFAAGADL